MSKHPHLLRVVVGIDPAATCHSKSDETGIIVAGLSQQGYGYVLDDFSGKYTPSGWAQKAVDAYHFYKADRIVAEVNKGGDMVEAMIRSVDASVSFKGIHASRNKQTRAEPVAALYEQGRVFHTKPFPILEDQLCSYTPHTTLKSPDRLDALVWSLTDLMLSKNKATIPSVW